MVGIDTNVLVRYLARDDKKQSERVVRFIEGLSSAQPGFVPLPVLVELVWVMKSIYGATKPEIIKILEMLLRTREFVVERPEIVAGAVHLFSSSKADFADCLIERSARAAGCAYTITFDQKAVYSGMRLVPE